MAKRLQALRNLRRQDLHSFLVLAAITSAGINIFLMGFYIKETEYILLTMILSICILLSSPLHYANTPIRSQDRSSSTIWLLLSSMISTALICIRYKMTFFILAEISLSIITILYELPLKIASVTKQIQKAIARKKLENATGWLLYPTGYIAGALYYSVVFAIYIIRFYNLIGCNFALFILILLFIVSISFFILFLCTIILFNKSVVVKISVCRSKALTSDSIYRVTSHGSKWLLHNKSGKIILKVPHSMVGDMQKLIFMSKSRKAKQKE